MEFVVGRFATRERREHRAFTPIKVGRVSLPHRSLGEGGSLDRRIIGRAMLPRRRHPSPPLGGEGDILDFLRKALNLGETNTSESRKPMLLGFPCD